MTQLSDLLAEFPDNDSGEITASNIRDLCNAVLLTGDVGSSAGDIVALDGSAKLPAVDGSQLINLPSSGGTTLPTDSAGYLYDDGSGNLSWQTITSGGGTTLPTDSAGYLYDDGSGNLSWQTITSGGGTTLPTDSAGYLYDDGSGNLSWTSIPSGTLPADSAGYLADDGSGNLSWSNPLAPVGVAPSGANGTATPAAITIGNESLSTLSNAQGGSITLQAGTGLNGNTGDGQSGGTLIVNGGGDSFSVGVSVSGGLAVDTLTVGGTAITGITGGASLGNLTATGQVIAAASTSDGYDSGASLELDAGVSDVSGGSVILNAGSAGVACASGAGGSVTINAGGDQYGGGGASLTLSGADGGGIGGNATISLPSGGSGSNSNGNFVISNLPTADPHVVGACWLDTIVDSNATTVNFLAVSQG